MADERLQAGQKKNNSITSRPIDDEEEETYLYAVRKPMEFINEGENGVFDVKKPTGLNSAKSVFDKYSTFKT